MTKQTSSQIKKAAANAAYSDWMRANMGVHGRSSDAIPRSLKDIITTNQIDPAYQQTPAPLEYEQEQSVVSRLIDLISRPLYAGAGLLQAAGPDSQDKNPFAEMWQGLTGEDKSTPDKVLQEKGVIPSEGAAGAIAGFAANMLLDPLNLVPMSWAGKFVKAGRAKRAEDALPIVDPTVFPDVKPGGNQVGAGPTPTPPAPDSVAVGALPSGRVPPGTPQLPGRPSTEAQRGNGPFEGQPGRAPLELPPAGAKLPEVNIPPAVDNTAAPTTAAESDVFPVLGDEPTTVTDWSAQQPEIAQGLLEYRQTRSMQPVTPEKYDVYKQFQTDGAPGIDPQQKKLLDEMLDTYEAKAERRPVNPDLHQGPEPTGYQRPTALRPEAVPERIKPETPGDRAIVNEAVDNVNHPDLPNTVHPDQAAVIAEDVARREAQGLGSTPRTVAEREVLDNVEQTHGVDVRQAEPTVEPAQTLHGNPATSVAEAQGAAAAAKDLSEGQQRFVDDVLADSPLNRDERGIVSHYTPDTITALRQNVDEIIKGQAIRKDYTSPMLVDRFRQARDDLLIRTRTRPKRRTDFDELILNINADLDKQLAKVGKDGRIAVTPAQLNLFKQYAKSFENVERWGKYSDKGHLLKEYGLHHSEAPMVLADNHALDITNNSIAARIKAMQDAGDSRAFARQAEKTLSDEQFLEVARNNNAGKVTMFQEAIKMGHVDATAQKYLWENVITKTNEDIAKELGISKYDFFDRTPHLEKYVDKIVGMEDAMRAKGVMFTAEQISKPGVRSYQLSLGDVLSAALKYSDEKAGKQFIKDLFFSGKRSNIPPDWMLRGVAAAMDHNSNIVSRGAQIGTGGSRESTIISAISRTSSDENRRLFAIQKTKEAQVKEIRNKPGRTEDDQAEIDSLEHEINGLKTQQRNSAAKANNKQIVKVAKFIDDDEFIGSVYDAVARNMYRQDIKDLYDTTQIMSNTVVPMLMKMVDPTVPISQAVELFTGLGDAIGVTANAVGASPLATISVGAKAAAASEQILGEVGVADLKSAAKADSVIQAEAKAKVTNSEASTQLNAEAQRRVDETLNRVSEDIRLTREAERANAPHPSGEEVPVNPAGDPKHASESIAKDPTATPPAPPPTPPKPPRGGRSGGSAEPPGEPPKPSKQNKAKAQQAEEDWTERFSITDAAAWSRSQRRLVKKTATWRGMRDVLRATGIHGYASTMSGEYSKLMNKVQDLYKGDFETLKKDFSGLRADPNYISKHPELKAAYNQVGDAFTASLTAMFRNGISYKTINKILEEITKDIPGSKNWRFIDGAVEGRNTIKKMAEQMNEWSVADPVQWMKAMHSVTMRATGYHTTAHTFRAHFGSAHPKPGYVRPDPSTLNGPVSRYLDSKAWYDPEHLKAIPMLDYVAGGSRNFRNQEGLLAGFVNKFYDPVFEIFKTYATIANPAHHFRNMIGEGWANWVAGMSFAEIGKNLKISHQIIQGQATKYVLKNKAGMSFAGDEIKIAFDRYGLRPSYAVIEQLDELGKGKIKNAFVHNPWTKFGGFISENTSSYGRMSQFLHELQHADNIKVAGGSKDKLYAIAAAKVRRAHPDSGGLTNGEAKWMTRIIPFYSWQKQMLPFLAEMSIYNPARTIMAPIKANYSLAVANGADPQSMSEQWDESYPFPNFLTNNPLGPVTAGGVGINPELPIMNLLGTRGIGAGVSDWGDFTKNLASSITPVAKIPLEMISNTNFGTGGKIKDTGEYLTRQVPLLSKVPGFTGVDPFGTIGTLVGPDGPHLDPTTKELRGENDQTMAWVNWLTGLGLTRNKSETYGDMGLRERR